MRRHHVNVDAFPIPGAAGVAALAALRAIALYPGEAVLTVKKERLTGGGYIYLIAETQTPHSTQPKEQP